MIILFIYLQNNRLHFMFTVYNLLASQKLQLLYMYLYCIICTIVQICCLLFWEYYIILAKYITKTFGKNIQTHFLFETEIHFIVNSIYLTFCKYKSISFIEMRSISTPFSFSTKGKQFFGKLFYYVLNYRY